MATVGVFGLFRVNEICSVKSKQGLKTIRIRDVVFLKGHAQITIFNTKTKDKVIKVLADIKGQRCNPCGLLWSFIMSKTRLTGDDDPLFTDQNGKAVTRAMLIKFLRTKLAIIFPDIDVKEWNGASLRKGGATSAVKAGVHSEVIEKLGHWTSDGYKRYIHCSVNDIMRAQVACASLTTKPDDVYLH